MHFLITKLVLTVSVIISDLALIRRVAIVVDEQFLALFDVAYGTKEYFFGGIDKMIAHIRRIRMVIQAAITEH